MTANVRPTHRATLVETDQPELVLAVGEGRDWLGVLSSAREGATSWVYTPLSPDELKGIHEGTLELRACFRGRKVLVVSEREAEVRVDPTDGDALPEALLPARGFVLPPWAR